MSYGSAFNFSFALCFGASLFAIACAKDVSDDKSGSQIESTKQLKATDKVCVIDYEVGKVCGQRSQVAALLRSWGQEGVATGQQFGQEANRALAGAKAFCMLRNASVVAGSVVGFYIAATGVTYVVGGTAGSNAASVYSFLPRAAFTARQSFMAGNMAPKALSVGNWVKEVLGASTSLQTSAAALEGITLAGISTGAAVTSQVVTSFQNGNVHDQISCAVGKM